MQTREENLKNTFAKIAQKLNALKGLIDDIDVGGGSSYSFMKRSSTSTANASSFLVIPWETSEEVFGSAVTWSSTNNTRLTAAENGVYKLGGFVTYTTPQQRGQATVEILKNGVPQGIFRGGSYIRNTGASWDFWSIELSPEPFNLVVGDYLELRLVRHSGANNNYAAGTYGTITLRGQSSKIWLEKVA